MEPSLAEPTPGLTHDSDLDPPPQRGAVDDQPPLLPQEYQRLVANPFLAIFALIGCVHSVQQAFSTRTFAWLGLAVFCLLAAGCLLHYHCLDCGATGTLLLWKRHACPSVLARRQTGRVRRLRGPNPVVQTVLWGYLLVALGILAAVLLRADVP